MQAGMSTLYVRNLPDDVMAALQELAKREGVSVNTLAIRELSQVARSASNAAILDDLHRRLPKLDITVDDILQALHQGRETR